MGHHFSIVAIARLGEILRTAILMHDPLLMSVRAPPAVRSAALSCGSL
jgi:hypothetical protein